MTAPKSTREPDVKKEAPEKTGWVENFIPVYEKSMQRAAELGKKSLEIAADQNAEWIDACKKSFRLTPETPGAFVLDLLGKTFHRVVETNQGALDFAVEQSEVVAGYAKARG